MGCGDGGGLRILVGLGDALGEVRPATVERARPGGRRELQGPPSQRVGKAEKEGVENVLRALINV